MTFTDRQVEHLEELLAEIESDRLTESDIEQRIGQLAKKWRVPVRDIEQYLAG
jgi:hypothetical protein